jgi:hypothetical protein
LTGVGVDATNEGMGFVVELSVRRAVIPLQWNADVCGERCSERDLCEHKLIPASR